MIILVMAAAQNFVSINKELKNYNRHRLYITH